MALGSADVRIKASSIHLCSRDVATLCLNNFLWPVSLADHIVIVLSRALPLPATLNYLKSWFKKKIFGCNKLDNVNKMSGINFHVSISVLSVYQLTFVMNDRNSWWLSHWQCVLLGTVGKIPCVQLQLKSVAVVSVRRQWLDKYYTEIESHCYFLMLSVSL